MPLCFRHILCKIAVIVCVLASGASAQNSSDRGTPADSKKGQSTQSTYERDKIETVNLANGNFSLSIPLTTVGGRGSASFTIALSYNSKVWTTQSEDNGVFTGGGAEGTPRNIYSAMYDKTDPEDYEPYLYKLGGGWSILMAPGIKAVKFGIDPLTSGCSGGAGQPDCGVQYVLTKMWLTLPDGSQVELRDAATQGAPARTTNIVNGYHLLEDRDRGRLWQSVDGSGVIFVRDPGYPLGQAASEREFPSGWVFLRDGTRMRMDQGVGSKIIDRNGNFISLNGSTYTDQLGRQTDVIPGPPLTVTVKGYMGTPDRSLTVDVGAIGDLINLRADFHSLPRPFTTGDAFRDALDNFHDHTIQTPHTDLFVKSEGNSRYGTAGLDVGTKTAVTQLHLSDGRSLRFRYNQYGEVAEIIYPGGGVSQIDYDGGNSGNCEIRAPFVVNRVVGTRRTFKSDGTVEATWLYLPEDTTIDGVIRPGVRVEAHQGGVTGTLLLKEKHFFRMLNAEYRPCGGPYTGTGNEKWENAKEFRTEIYNGTGMTVTTRNWQQQAAVVWANDVGLTYNAYVNEQYHGQDQPPNNPRIVSEETTLEDGKVKRVEYGYDQFNNVISLKEYDFDTGGSPGALLRQTSRTYATSLNGYCYSNLNPADSNCGNGLASDVTAIIYQPGLLLNETVRDGAGAQQSYSEFEYDNYTTQPNHAPIYPNNGMIQYDSGKFTTFASATQPRGNVTKVTRWLGGGTDVIAYSQYDKAGQVVWSKDPNGNIGTVSYADNYGGGDDPESGSSGANGATYALPSVATNALGQTVKMQYNYALGAATGVKDANGVITKTEYDNLGRPFRVTAALGLTEQSVSVLSYPTLQENSARVSKQLDAVRWLTSKTDFDGFGRAITSWQSEDGQTMNLASFTIRADTVYDAIGRVRQASNPYRPASETPIYATTAFDLAGRVVSVTTPDNAVVTTSYYANTVTVSDQMQRQRKSVTDALGRLTQVYEAPNDPNYNYLTSYGYNTLDNLTSVSQGTQTRTFVYDSLKRLISATNPESGTICYGTVSGGQCQADGYDANGNLLYKTDARGVRASYTYDELNRSKGVSYSSDDASTPTVIRTYDNPAAGANGLGRPWKTETAGTSLTTIAEYDALGRPRTQKQQFFRNNGWGSSFTISAAYDKAGHVLAETYPSGHSTSYNFDAAGRLGDKDAQQLAFTGNLGDGIQRTYAAGISYTSLGAMQEEKFGTAIPLYHKQRQNQRGQLWDVRLSTVPFASDPADGDRGAIVNYYSNTYAQGGSGNDNNGNLLRQEIYLPGNGFFQDNFDYDSLNRLTAITEKLNGAGNNSFKQAYSYDRYGNRSIDYNATSAGLPRTQFVVDPNTNRLTVPNGQSGTMHYDPAGNLDTDTYSGAAALRLYDAENRMARETQANGSIAGSYSYDGDGRRIKRTANGVETWQVYGLGGELLADYAADASPTNPQREYGYRNGQLLVTAEGASRTNVALAANGGIATAQDYTQDGYYAGQNLHFQPAYANDGIRYISPSGDQYWRDHHGLSTWLEIDFNGAKTINEVDVYTVRDDWPTQGDPAATETFTAYGATAFEVQYLNGSTWTNVPGGAISNNQLLWRKLTFSALTTTGIRVKVNAAPDGVARLDEVEVWSITNPTTPPRNMALAANGGVATAPHYTQDGYYAGQDLHFQPSYANDGTRYMGPSGDRYWRDEHGLPSAIEIAFSGAKTIDEIDVFTCRDDYATQADPNATQTFSNYGTTSFQLEYWNGSNWVVLPNGSITGNSFVWRKISFSAVTTTKIKVTVNAAPDGVARLMEVEAWGYDTANVHWLVTDQLGTPRMIVDQTGALSGISRHDYLPFGEELFGGPPNQPGAGGRLPTQGYNAGDSIRQKFTQKERDIETGLDYFGARYYSSMQGRFTSPDDFAYDTHAADPQSWNLYSYVRNNPLRYVDPDGHIKKDKDGNIIFEKTGEQTTRYITDEPVTDENGQVKNDSKGKPYTFSISWQSETGYVFADDGTKIKAERPIEGLQVVVKDSDGNVSAEGTREAERTLKAEGFSNYADCHGVTFAQANAQAKIWIGNGEVGKIITGDGYRPTNNPAQGDVGVYTLNGNLATTRHSVSVNSVNARGAVIGVTSKAGITRQQNTTPGPGPNTAWPDPTVRLQYFTKRVNQ
jgi:RHS repeat-associated protein